MTRRSKAREIEAKPLYETLVALKSPVATERLFEAAGYDRDSAADVEAFYLALRDELDVRIRQSKTSEGMLLEVVKDATR